MVVKHKKPALFALVFYPLLYFRGHIISQKKYREDDLYVDK